MHWLTRPIRSDWHVLNTRVHTRIELFYRLGLMTVLVSGKSSITLTALP